MSKIVLQSRLIKHGIFISLLKTHKKILNFLMTDPGPTAQSNCTDIKEESQEMDILSFCRLLGNLKHLPRTGWVRKSVPGPVETVSGHMYRMAVLAFFINDHPKPTQNSPGDNSSTSASQTQNSPKLCQTKCIKMALVHDMAESIVGDITPHCGVSEDEKYRRENEAMNRIRNIVSGKLGEELYQLWREYEDQSSPEAKVVKELDKFDMIMQAYEYETAHEIGGGEKKKSLEEFFSSSEGLFENGLIKDWVKKLNEKRNAE